MIRHLFIVSSIAVILGGCGDSSPKLTDAWIRLSPPGMRMTAGYMNVTNHTSRPVTVVGLSSPVFSEIEIHRTQTIDGKARMLEQKQLVIPAGEKVSFEPGGLHLMLMGLQNELTEDQSIELTVYWADGTTTPINAIVSRRAPK